MALFRVYNDIAMFIDKKKSVVLVLLDLSAAFDRVDRSLLLSRLSACFGICHQALDWLRSYLSECTHTSEFKMSLQMCMPALTYWVPQWSVLGLYSLYTSHNFPLRWWPVLSQFHADDTKLYLSFETSLPEDLLTCKSGIDNRIKDIDLWMLENKLKLNSGKTEIIVFSFSCCLRPVLNNLVIASDTVDRCSTVAKNNGVIINNSLSMVPHVTAVCKSSFFHLRNF